MENIKFNSKIKSFSLEASKLKENTFKCPDILPAIRYKIKQPNADHAVYVIISDVTHNGKTFPYEIFITTKDPEHQMWVQALTRVISAIFRKGEDISFLIEELKGIYDPKGGYRKKGGDWSNSLVADIGDIISLHLSTLNGKTIQSFPEDAIQCNKCNTKAVVILDGCPTCLNCNYSKCS